MFLVFEQFKISICTNSWFNQCSDLFLSTFKEDSVASNATKIYFWSCWTSNCRLRQQQHLDFVSQFLERTNLHRLNEVVETVDCWNRFQVERRWAWVRMQQSISHLELSAQFNFWLIRRMRNFEFHFNAITKFLWFESQFHSTRIVND